MVKYTLSTVIISGMIPEEIPLGNWESPAEILTTGI